LIEGGWGKAVEENIILKVLKETSLRTTRGFWIQHRDLKSIHEKICNSVNMLIHYVTDDQEAKVDLTSLMLF